jgi:hypothetical protein
VNVLESPSKISFEFTDVPNGPDVRSSELYADDPRWQLAQRISVSGSIGRSRKLSDFLRYVVERHLSNRPEEITEQQIGVQVFGRHEDYDPGEDNIVRSYARTLRERIQKYFETEGKEEELLLEVPRGGYEPTFTLRRSSLEPTCEEVLDPEHGTLSTFERVSEDAAPSADSDVLSPEADGNRSVLEWIAGLFRRIPILALVVGAFFGACLTVMIVWIRPRLFHEEVATGIFWHQLFSSDHDTFIVPSDNGLVIMQGLIPSPLPLSSYVDGSYKTNARSDDSWGVQRLLLLGSRRYTSVTDLEIASRLSQLNTVAPQRTMIRYAHDLRMDDLRTGNVVLLGATQSNPWVQLFQPQMHFRFRFDKSTDKELVITNEHPMPGEASLYTHMGDEHTYGIIAYVPNLSSTGHVLIVGGVNMAGTQAAGDVLLNASLIAPTLERARTKTGDLQPFELLIESDNVAANASSPHIVLERIGLPATN